MFDVFTKLLILFGPHLLKVILSVCPVCNGTAGVKPKVQVVWLPTVSEFEETEHALI